MATLLKVLNNLAHIKSAGGVALRVRTQAAAKINYFPIANAPIANAVFRLIMKRARTQ